MAWTWVSEIKNPSTGETLKFIVPTGFTFDPNSRPFSATKQDQTYSQSAANRLIVAAILAQEAKPQFCGDDKRGTTLTYLINGGALRVTSISAESNNRNRFQGDIKNYLGTTITSWNSMTNPYADWSNYTVYASTAGLCAIINDEEQKMYVGTVIASHQERPDYYSWRADVDITNYDYANVYQYFRGLIPSGGGGSDPYEAGGYSDTTPSSSGDFDDDSDSIAVPSLPSISAMGAGAVSLAVIDEANLGTFMNYILSPSFTGLSNISRFFSDPIKAIACLNYMPYTPTNTSGYTLSWGGDDTGASVGAVSAQYEEIDCGSVDLTEFYGSCLDFSPYTTVQLVLPFAGSVDIDPDEFNGKTISVKYHIDNYTGAGLVLVSDGDRVLLQVPCSVSNPIPLTSTDYSAVISAIANVVMGGISTIAAVYTGGASVGASVALAGGFAASAAGNVMSAKLHYNHGGSMGMGTGMFGVLKPYLIIKRPRQCLPEGNGSFQGYPTFVTENLGDLSGFTKIAEIHLDSIPVTTAERAELLAILKGGVIF